MNPHMVRFLKSTFLVWIPVFLVLTVIHNVFWGEIDLSSAYVGIVGVLLAQLLDILFDLD